MSVRFKATNEQLRHLQATATNASKPVGMGYVHYKPEKVFTADDFHPDHAQSTDYVQGRMVKCYARKVDGQTDQYELDEPREDYQSWSVEYPTARALVEAGAGLTVVLEAQPAAQET